MIDLYHLIRYGTCHSDLSPWWWPFITMVMTLVTRWTRDLAGLLQNIVSGGALSPWLPLPETPVISTSCSYSAIAVYAVTMATHAFKLTLKSFKKYDIKADAWGFILTMLISISCAVLFKAAYPLSQPLLEGVCTLKIVCKLMFKWHHAFPIQSKLRKWLLQ